MEAPAAWCGVFAWSELVLELECVECLPAGAHGASCGDELLWAMDECESNGKVEEHGA